MFERDRRLGIQPIKDFSDPHSFVAPLHLQRLNGRGRTYHSPKGTIDPFIQPQERILASQALPTETKRKPRSRPAPNVNPHFPIIGVGTSAGGPEPFLEVPRNGPADSRLATIYLQHSERAHPR